MLDHMSGGRLEIGFGRGSVPFEISYYGQNAEERQQIYAERLELILKAFTVRTLTWNGRYDQFKNVRSRNHIHRYGTEHIRLIAPNAPPERA
jgi:alkanesulfonate monooxygenase SsuD/methylene tetrahydromethanopterin reductase-like flavin-dependent oxidoreductase (luciferase family)